MRFSTNNKTNSIILEITNNIIYSFNETYDEVISELNRHKAEYYFESDFNIAQNGNLLIYYYDIRKLFKDCGYKNIEKLSDNAIWNKYKALVGLTVNKILNNKSQFKKDYFE